MHYLSLCPSDFFGIENFPGRKDANEAVNMDPDIMRREVRNRRRGKADIYSGDGMAGRQRERRCNREAGVDGFGSLSFKRCF